MADFFSEAVPLLLNYATQGQQEAEIMAYFQKILSLCPRISIALILTNYLIKTQDALTGIQFLTQYLTQQPSIRGLHYLLFLLTTQTDIQTQLHLNILQTLLETILKNKPSYLCH